MEGLVRLDKHWRKPDVCLFFIRVVGQVREKMTILIQNMSWYQILRPGASQRLRKTGVFQCQKTVDGLCRYSNKKDSFWNIHLVCWACTESVSPVPEKSKMTGKTDFHGLNGPATLYDEKQMDIDAWRLVSGIGQCIGTGNGAPRDTPKKHDIKRWNIFVLKMGISMWAYLYDTRECN